MAEQAQGETAAQALRTKNRTEAIEQVKEHVAAASGLLKPLGGDFERVAWMLEDSLMYLDEALYHENERRGKPVEKSDQDCLDERVEMS